MSQKRNKIIVLVALLISIIGLIFIGYEYKFKKPLVKETTTTTTKGVDYAFLTNECLRYLNQPQKDKNSQGIEVTFTPPQIFCEVLNDNQVSLIPNSELTSAIKPSKTIITIINTEKLFTPEYFKTKNIKDVSSFNQDFKLCLTVYPVSSLFTTFPPLFSINQITNNQINNCASFNPKTFHYLSVITQIPNIPLNKFFLNLSIASQTNSKILIPLYTLDVNLK